MLDVDLALKAVPGERTRPEPLTEVTAQGRNGSKMTVSTASTRVSDGDDIDMESGLDVSNSSQRTASPEINRVTDVDVINIDMSDDSIDLVSAVRSAMSNLGEEATTPMAVTTPRALRSANSETWKSPGETLILALQLRQRMRPTTFTLDKEPTTPMSVTSGRSVRSPKAPKWNSPGETLIFLDWDDTLCPTTSCQHIVQTARMSPTEKELLDAHEVVVIDLLKRASKLGRCVIVTMAVTAWVSQCIAKLMPRVGDLLQELQIEVVSARESFVQRLRRSAFSDDRDPNQYLKTKAMQRIIKQFYKRGGRQRMGLGTSRPWKNIISIGDADGERLALQDLVFRKSQSVECRCKTLLLLDCPSLEQLTTEVRYLTAMLPALISNDGDLHVDMTVDEVVGLVEAVATGPGGGVAQVVEMALDRDVLLTNQLSMKAACVVVTTDQFPFVIVSANDAWFNMWGFDPNEAIGSPISILNGKGSDKSASQELYASFLQSSKQTIRCRNTAKDGRCRSHDAVLSKLDGHIRCYSTNFALTDLS